MRTILRGAAWTVVGYGAVQALRFGTNLVLTRLLVPELFGIMVIVNSVRTGIELLSDVGIGQSIIANPHAEEPEFYNTAWTVQIVRGAGLAICLAAAADFIGRFYHIEVLGPVLRVCSIGFVISGLTSMNLFLVQRRLQLAKFNMYETISVLFWAAGQLGLVWWSPTIWSLVYALILGALAATIGSYFLLDDTRHRLQLNRTYVGQIIHFGKWISLSSIVYYLSISFDRLYFAGVVSLSQLGVYGLARGMTDLITMLTLKLGNTVIFPIMAATPASERPRLREQLLWLRGVFLILAGIGFSILSAFSDLLITIIFDVRYHAAGWMLPIMLMGAWVSMLSSLNDSMLMGLGKPFYAAAGNGFKLIGIVVGVPLAVSRYGLEGGLVLLSFSELLRYVVIFIGQRRERFSFASQDALLTVGLAILIATLFAARASYGWGTPFDLLR